MGSIDTFFLPPQLKCSVFPRSASSNISVRCYLLEGFAFRHGEKTLLDLQDLCHP